jgi:predicted nuclease of predicted toxin-antitoxin system
MAGFLLDEDVNPTAAEIARGHHLDVVSVHEIGRRNLDDWEQLAYAASEKRILVTRNRDDFIKLTVSAYQTQKPHCGVLIVPYSIPNKHPERIARALKVWCDNWGQAAEGSTYFIDFLSSE